MNVTLLVKNVTVSDIAGNYLPKRLNIIMQSSHHNKLRNNYQVVNQDHGVLNQRKNVCLSYIPVVPVLANEQDLL